MPKTLVIYCPTENIVGFYGLTSGKHGGSALGVDNRKVGFPKCPINHHEGHSAVGVAVEVPPTQINPSEDEFDREWLKKFNTAALEEARPILSISSEANMANLNINEAVMRNGMTHNPFNPWRRK